MIGYAIGFIVVGLWLAFEIWRAPVGLETKDGGWKTLRPTRHFKDLFKKKNSNSSSYSDLQKYGRGRSKY